MSVLPTLRIEVEAPKTSPSISPSNNATQSIAKSTESWPCNSLRSSSSLPLSHTTPSASPSSAPCLHTPCHEAASSSLPPGLLVSSSKEYKEEAVPIEKHRGDSYQGNEVEGVEKTKSLSKAMKIIRKRSFKCAPPEPGDRVPAPLHVSKFVEATMEHIKQYATEGERRGSEPSCPRGLYGQEEEGWGTHEDAEDTRMPSASSSAASSPFLRSHQEARERGFLYLAGKKKETQGNEGGSGEEESSSRRTTPERCSTGRRSALGTQELLSSVYSTSSPADGSASGTIDMPSGKEESGAADYSESPGSSSNISGASGSRPPFVLSSLSRFLPFYQLAIREIIIACEDKARHRLMKKKEQKKRKRRLGRRQTAAASLSQMDEMEGEEGQQEGQEEEESDEESSRDDGISVDGSVSTRAFDGPPVDYGGAEDADTDGGSSWLSGCRGHRRRHPGSSELYRFSGASSLLYAGSSVLGGGGHGNGMGGGSSFHGGDPLHPAYAEDPHRSLHSDVASSTGSGSTHALRGVVPNDSIQHFLTELSWHMGNNDSTPLVFITALVFLSRIARRSATESDAITAQNWFRMTTISLLVAFKMYSEDPLVFKANRHFAQCAHMSVEELNRLEVYFLYLVDFDLFLQERDITCWVTWMESLAYSTGLVTPLQNFIGVAPSHPASTVAFSASTQLPYGDGDSVLEGGSGYPYSAATGAVLSLSPSYTAGRRSTLHGGGGGYHHSDRGGYADPFRLTSSASSSCSCYGHNTWGALSYPHHHHHYTPQQTPEGGARMTTMPGLTSSSDMGSGDVGSAGYASRGGSVNRVNGDGELLPLASLQLHSHDTAACGTPSGTHRAYEAKGGGNHLNPMLLHITNQRPPPSPYDLQDSGHRGVYDTLSSPLTLGSSDYSCSPVHEVTTHVGEKRLFSAVHAGEGGGGTAGCTTETWRHCLSPARGPLVSEIPPTPPRSSPLPLHHLLRQQDSYGDYPFIRPPSPPSPDSLLDRDSLLDTEREEKCASSSPFPLREPPFCSSRRMGVSSSSLCPPRPLPVNREEKGRTERTEEEGERQRGEDAPPDLAMSRVVQGDGTLSTTATASYRDSGKAREGGGKARESAAPPSASAPRESLGRRPLSPPSPLGDANDMATHRRAARLTALRLAAEDTTTSTLVATGGRPRISLVPSLSFSRLSSSVKKGPEEENGEETETTTRIARRGWRMMGRDHKNAKAGETPSPTPLGATPSTPPSPATATNPVSTPAIALAAVPAAGTSTAWKKSISHPAPSMASGSSHPSAGTPMGEGGTTGVTSTTTAPTTMTSTMGKPGKEKTPAGTTLAHHHQNGTTAISSKASIPIGIGSRVGPIRSFVSRVREVVHYTSALARGRFDVLSPLSPIREMGFEEGPPEEEDGLPPFSSPWSSPSHRGGVEDDEEDEEDEEEEEEDDEDDHGRTH